MASHDISYEYDAAGNRTRMIDNLSGEVTTYTYDDCNQLLTMDEPGGTTTFTYDEDGNRTRKETPTELTEYTWDAENHLTDIQTVNDEIHLTYNSDGQRVKKESNVGTVSYLYDFNHLLQEMNGDDQTEKVYTFTDDEWGDLISEYSEEDGSLYHQYDAQWSTEALLDEDQSVTDRYKYRAFGLQDHAQGTSKNPHTFVGKQGYYRDTELDLYLLGMGNGDGLGGRFYDPELGRFISEDPRRHEAGDENLYRYVKNNPINDIDPSGQARQKVFETEKSWTDYEGRDVHFQRKLEIYYPLSSTAPDTADVRLILDASCGRYWLSGPERVNVTWDGFYIEWYNEGASRMLTHKIPTDSGRVPAVVPYEEFLYAFNNRNRWPTSGRPPSGAELKNAVDKWFAEEANISNFKPRELPPERPTGFAALASAALSLAKDRACSVIDQLPGRRNGDGSSCWKR